VNLIFCNLNCSLDKVNVFPNPCISTVTFLLPNNPIQRIKFFTLEGRNITIPSTNNLEFGINSDVSSLSAGVYFVEIYSNSRNYYQSFLKVTP